MLVPDEAMNVDEPFKDDDLLCTVTSSDGFEEDPYLKLKMDSDRLMNGNLYKIRAEVTGMVKWKKKDKDDKKVKGKKEQHHDDGDQEMVMKKKTYWVLDDLAGGYVRVLRADLIKKTKIIHAYALTIHKMQGSEADTIVYGLSGSMYENWQHVYTAVTRGKKNVIIVGSYEDLRKAIQENRKIDRQTALGEKVKKLLEKVLAEKKEKKDDSMEDVEKKNENFTIDCGP